MCLTWKEEVILTITCFFLSLCLSTCLFSGEEEFSFAYDRHGKKVSAGKEEEFGEPFSEGDIIGCYAVSDNFLFTFSCLLIV